jgi:threonine dehydrogenase-like Zn-dependent dehydrogenase
MKLYSFIAAAALAQNVVAFAPIQRGQRASFLNMNVEKVEQKTIKVGVIGAGRIGLVHLEAITKAPGVTPVIISNPTISKAESGKLG